jgi:hypothetical protein
MGANCATIQVTLKENKKEGQTEYDAHGLLIQTPPTKGDTRHIPCPRKRTTCPETYIPLEYVICPGKREGLGRLNVCQHAVSFNSICLRVNMHLGRSGIPFHGTFPDRAAPLHGLDSFLQAVRRDCACGG